MRPFIEQISKCAGNRSVPEFPATKPRGDATYSRMGEKLAAEIIAERPTDVRPRKLADACGEETRSKIAAIGDASSVAHDTVHQGTLKAHSIPLGLELAHPCECHGGSSAYARARGSPGIA